jgi:type 1 fimbriae regulatory protein FimB/type 1 fimbriae regulatory protein FimE
MKNKTTHKKTSAHKTAQYSIMAELPKRQCNEAIRPREYLTIDEVKELIKGAKDSPWYGSRDATLILLMFRHGLRVSEAVDLTWDQINFKLGVLHVTRLKGGTPSTHPLKGDELRALRALHKQAKTQFLFTSNRGGPLSIRTAHLIVANAGKRAGFEYSIHPHMLRHSTGFHLAMQEHDTRAIQFYMGHKSITNTVKYTQISSERFKSFKFD